MAAPGDVLFKLEKGLGVGNPIVSGAQRVEGSAVCALTTRSFMKRETSGAGAGGNPSSFHSDFGSRHACLIEFCERFKG